MFQTKDPWIKDLSPKTNFLSKSIYYRLDSFDPKLWKPRYKDDLLPTQPSPQTPLDSNKDFIGEENLDKGLFPEDSPSVLLDRQKTPCFQLVPDLTQERVYFRDCIQNPEECDYGLSFAVWVYFIDLATAPSQETIVSTGVFEPNAKMVLPIQFTVLKPTCLLMIQPPTVKLVSQWLCKTVSSRFN